MENELAVIEQHEQAGATDLRHAMMTLPVEHQDKLLAEYKDRRDNFRAWLKAQLIEGIHFGFPPGCEPESQVIDGVLCYKVWAKGGAKWYPETQWTPKPPLYAAGADFLCDLCGVRPEYKADLQAWQQIGSPPDTFVLACYLWSKGTGELLGEGRGVRKVGTKGGDANNSIKMAEKSAKIDAVINTYGLRDLFTQEEEAPRPPHDNPESDPTAPSAQPRNKRGKTPTTCQISEDQLGHVSAHWKAVNPSPTGNLQEQKQAFKDWARRSAERDFDPGKRENWTVGDFCKCCDALGIDQIGVPQE
jgi:hypothetical protein